MAVYPSCSTMNHLCSTAARVPGDTVCCRTFSCARTQEIRCSTVCKAEMMERSQVPVTAE